MQRSQRPLGSTCIKVAGIALLGVACSVFARDRNDRIDARLKSFREVPAVSSPATGRFRATFDEKAGAISYDLTYSGLETAVLMAHIHLGQRGVNGGIMVWLCQTTSNPDPTGLAPTCPQSGTVSGVIQAANVIGPAGQGITAGEFEEFIAAIRAGVAYANVHSVAFPGGEIRGQLDDHDD